MALLLYILPLLLATVICEDYAGSWANRVPFEGSPDATVARAHPAERFWNGRRVEYWLFTRENPLEPQYLYEGNVQSLQNSNFDPNKITRFIVHGWLDHGRSDLNPSFTREFLALADENVIVVDWSSLSRGLYVTAAWGSPDIGRTLGRFVRFLNQQRLPYSNIHLVGFSLGAHIVGIAGRENGGAVQKITGLDPARPYWTTNGERIRSTDGVHVEVIHTNACALGIINRAGDADFYPNRGSRQPGCSGIPAIGDSCSHEYAQTLFARTISNNGLIGIECATVDDARNGNCHGPGTAYMGGVDLNKNANGIFFLSTD